MSKLKIGIDIDNTITASAESIAFFSLITNLLKGISEIHIITNRYKDHKSVKKTIQELYQLNIYYDKLEITAEKSAYIIKEGISILFDDVDEYYLKLPSSVTVFKIREDGNFDFDKHKWIYGDTTGINIDIKQGE